MTDSTLATPALDGPAVYLFDAYGTLFDVHAAVRRHGDRLGDAGPAIGEHWRRKQLEYSWIAALSGRYRPFWTLTEDALDHALATANITERGVRDDLLQAYRKLACYPEVRPVLESLKEAGRATAILSNADPAMLEEAVEHAGIGGLLDAVLSVDAVGTYKPAPAVYQLAVDRFDLDDPGAAAFHSANAWDAAGALAFGFEVRWINRAKAEPEYADFGQATIWSDLAPLLAECGGGDLTS